MKLIHLRVYPRRVSKVRPLSRTVNKEEIKDLKEWEKEAGKLVLS